MATKRARSSGLRTTGKPSVPFGLGCAVTISGRAARTMPALGGDLQHLRPRHPRHVVVGDEQVVGRRREQVERLAAGRRRVDVEARAAQGEGHQVARVVVVFDEKQVEPVGPGARAESEDCVTGPVCGICMPARGHFYIGAPGRQFGKSLMAWVAATGAHPSRILPRW